MLPLSDCRSNSSQAQTSRSSTSWRYQKDGSRLAREGADGEVVWGGRCEPAWWTSRHHAHPRRTPCAMLTHMFPGRILDSTLRRQTHMPDRNVANRSDKQTSLYESDLSVQCVFSIEFSRCSTCSVSAFDWHMFACPTVERILSLGTT